MRDPAFLFYSQDFNTGTQFFTDEQVGKYIRLLIAQHQHGHLSNKQVLMICKSHDNEVMSKFAIDQDGCYFNERLENEVLRRKRFSDSRSENRKGKVKQEEETAEHSPEVIEEPKQPEPPKPERKPKQVKEPVVEVIYFDNLAVDELFKQFLNERIKWGKAATEYAIKLLVKTINKLPNDETRIEAIEKSIKSKWADIYPLKNDVIAAMNSTKPTRSTQVNNKLKQLLN